MDILIQNLCKTYQDKVVFSNYSETFTFGKITCLMGESGKGKTTLFRILSGIEKPQKGSIQGVPEKIAVCFQEDRLVEEFGAEANLHLMNRKLKQKEIEIALLLAGLTNEDLKQPVSQFSGGMKRRVSVLQTIMSDGELLLLDEPFSGLDMNTKSVMIDLIRKYQKGRTIFITTHDSVDVEMLGAEKKEL